MDTKLWRIKRAFAAKRLARKQIIKNLTVKSFGRPLYRSAFSNMCPNTHTYRAHTHTHTRKMLYNEVTISVMKFEHNSSFFILHFMIFFFFFCSDSKYMAENEGSVVHLTKLQTVLWMIRQRTKKKKGPDKKQGYCVFSLHICAFFLINNKMRSSTLSVTSRYRGLCSPRRNI